ncbi:MAG TPA: EamA family transporter [Gemmatimonadaceae bacterium]|nr:EamA family transporter [Gemmatimonadaceae bacterium]
MVNGHRSRSAFLALAAAGALWGTGFPLGKIALDSMSVGHMILYRYLFAVLALVPVAIVHRLSLPSRADVPRIVVAGALYVPIQFLIQFEGLARTTVSHASLMVGALPILVAVGAVAFAHETLDGIGWFTLGASTLGAALIVIGGSSGGGRASMAGDLLVILSLFAAVAWVLTSKGLMRPHGSYSAVEASVYVMFAGTALLAIWVLIVDGPPPLALPPVAWGAVMASGVVATAATTLLWNWGLTRVPASRAGVFLNLEPVVGVITGVTLLNEHLAPLSMLGGALIIGSAVLFTRRPVQAERRAPQS